MVRSVSRYIPVILVALLLPVAAHAALTVTPITWNIIGLDSNDPLNGPNTFPVGARVCSDVATTNVSATFVWDSANPYIDFRTGSLSTIVIPAIGAGQCADAYFEVEVVRDAAAFDTTRRYHITATDFSGTYSTPTPRELYVEHLISQNRNSISGVSYGPDAFTLTPVAPGGSLDLVVGNTYAIQLTGGTATQGYNQFEAFINFQNTIFQITDVETTYSADNSPFVPNPNDKLWADACLWENDPNDPNYRACVGGDFKAGGNNVVTTYTITIISGGGTSQTLNTLLYDFSGSSYHYNADFATGARIANVIDPTTADISKSFSPNPAPVNGVSTLTFTLTNPNPGTLAGYNFVDNLPANVVVATPPSATTNGCGTPTLTAVGGSSTISFSNGTVAANSSCVITVNVTASATGTHVNTTNNLFIGTIDTGNNATANLDVNNAPPPGTGLCNLTLARWTFPTGFSTTAPVPTTANVTATAAIGDGLDPASATNSTTTADGTLSWGTNGDVSTSPTLVTANNDYFEFALDTTGFSEVYLSFDATFRTANGPTGIAIFYGLSNLRPETGTQVFNNDSALTTQNTWVTFGAGNSIAFTTGLNPAGTTYFRIYPFNADSSSNGADFNLDNVLFTGCATPVPPTITKAFSPDPIAVNATSTLTFTLTNPNSAPLNGAAFTDSLPAGVEVAATPAAATTCGGTWAPTAGATSLTFSGGTIPVSGACTVSVEVTATTAGAHANVSGFLSTTESGTTITSTATAVLTAVLPPEISKQFDPSPILPGQTSTLTFIITNPNQDDALSGVAFTDTFPVAPGAMTVAAVPNATTSGCGAPTFAPTAGAGSISFSGGTIAGGGICVVTVDVTASTIGTYSNVSGNVSHIINAQTVLGNTASAQMEVEEPSPAISFLKQIGPSATGPWTSFLATTGQVWYRVTIENTGDVPFESVSFEDDMLAEATCNAVFAGNGPLPVAVAANENHIVSCIFGPFTWPGPTFTNTAHAIGIFNSTPYQSDDSTAIMAVPELTLAKAAAPATYTTAGETINYTYTVTNTGAAPLQGPVTVVDDKTTVTCPAVTTVGDLDNFLDPLEAIVCTGSYTIVAGDVAALSVTNTATASADGVNSNADSETVFFSGSADVEVTKDLDTNGPFSAGQSIQYTLTVTNNGPSTATNVSLADTPTNLTITNVSGACALFPCPIGTLNAGATVNVTVTATINANGAFDNSATVTATEPDPVPSNNTDNTGNNGIAGASADISVVKTLTTNAPYFAGQSVHFTLLVSNGGPSTATNVLVTDTPSNLTITAVSGAGCTALPCTIPSILAGGDATIDVDATINAAGTFDNVVVVDADEPDPNTGDNTDNAGAEATSQADLSIEKTLVTTGPYSAGQSITYTLFVVNNGPSLATTVTITDTPSNLSITSVSGGGCAALPCVIASLASGADVTITVQATIPAAGVFDNTAEVDAVEPDPNLSDNIDNTSNGGTAAPSADVSVLKTLVTVGPYSAGQSINYTLLVANGGPSPATNILVTDTPTNLTITSVSGACVALPCTIANLASGANTNINVTATIVAVGAFDNSATVDADEPDPDPSDNTDNTGNNGITGASADVSVVKTLLTAGPYIPGQSVSYTLAVANGGPSTATNIQVTDTPTNLSITSVSGACVALPCTIASLISGASTNINVTATIVAAGAFDNSATVDADEPDPDPSDNTDSVGNGGTAAPSADVSVVKTLVTAGPYSAGQSINYTLVVANGGPSTATNILVTDTPTNLSITSVSGACVALPCTIASLASGANTNINVTATIVAVGAFDNSATVDADEPDPDPSDNTDNIGNGGTTGPSADISVVKTLVTAGPYSAGQSINYTLVVANAGPSTATNILVTDTPTNLSITSVSGACVALPCTIPSLLSGASTNINVTATIVAAGAFNNSATVDADEPDPDPSDNTDNIGNGGTTGTPTADLAVSKTGSLSVASVGQTIDYTIVVTNNGPSTATGVVLIDPLPANLTFVSSNTTQGSCSGTTTVTCTIGTMGNGATVTVTIRGTVTAPGPFTNTATVTGNETDPVPGNNTSAFSVAPASVSDIPTASEYGLIFLALMLAVAGVVMRPRV